MNENNHDPAEIASEGSPWSRFWSRFVSAPDSSVAHRLYEQLVPHARFPIYYQRLGVPDTPEGRFEILALHVGLTVRKLLSLDDEGRATGQALFDLMVADLDMNLRELGVGDLSVGKQVKRMAGHFYARLAVLNEAFDEGRTDALSPMLLTNVFGGMSPSSESVAHLAEIVVTLQQALDRQPTADLKAGRIALPDEQALIIGLGDRLCDRSKIIDPGRSDT